MPAVTKGSNTPGAARITAFGLLAVCALPLGACDDGPSGPEQTDPAAFKWNAPVSAPMTVFIRDANGSVEVKPATGGNVEVTASVTWRRGDPKKDLKFETNNSAQGVTICALWGEGGSCEGSNYTVKGNKMFGRSRTDASVTFTVYVPTGVKVDIFTANGSIGVAATAPVKAQTLNGTVKVATSVGPVDAETVNGDVDVRMTTLGADGPVRAHSVNGSVAAYLPEKFDGTVDMRAVLGQATSDFTGLTKEDGEKKLTGVIGAGGRNIDLKTVTGSAALHKLKADGTPASP
jgi:hypothetical protein